MKLTGIHFLLSYQCTYECDHCFLYCGPESEGTFTIEQLRQVFIEIAKVESINKVYFEGGEHQALFTSPAIISAA